MDITDVLSGRAGLAGLRRVLFGPASRSWVRGELRALLEDGAVHRRSPPRRVKFKPGRKLTAHFDVWVRSGRSRGTRPIVVRWERTPNDRPLFSELEALEAEAADRGLLSPFLGLASRVRGGGQSILVWPLDPRLPQVVRLSHPAYVRELLATAGAGARPGPSTVSPIRYRPGERHVLQYRFRSGDAVFAKISRDGDVMREFRTARQVAGWLQDHGEEIGAAPPVAANVEDEVILFTGVRGRPLSQLLGRPGGQAGAPLRLAGSMLRRLHSAPSSVAEALPARGFHGEVEAVTRASEHIATLLPGAAERITEILNHARMEYDALPKEPASLIHGDFKADHLVVSGAGLTLIDFGSCGLGDPALDVGKFLADLEWWRLDRGRGTGDEEPKFLEAYGREAQHTRLSRSRVCQALFLVKLAAHRVPLFEEGWAARITLLVRRARTLLEPPSSGARRTTGRRERARAEGARPRST